MQLGMVPFVAAERTLNVALPQRKGADVDHQVAAADGAAGRSLILHRRRAGTYEAKRRGGNDLIVQSA
jgi:hypothetical protein